MAKKFKITICSGTTCYVLGGAHLLMLADMLPADLKDQDENARPPFVQINDYLMSQASVAKIVEYLRKH
jgi:NADH:ubiquinone oxidoreductase subunit E